MIPSWLADDIQGMPVVLIGKRGTFREAGVPRFWNSLDDGFVGLREDGVRRDLPLMGYDEKRHQFQADGVPSPHRENRVEWCQHGSRSRCVVNGGQNMKHLEWKFPLWSLVTKALLHKNGATRSVIALKDKDHGDFIPMFSTKELAESFRTEFFMGKAKTIQLLMVNDMDSFQEIVNTLAQIGCNYVAFDLQAKQGRPISGELWKTERFTSLSGD